MDVDGRKNWAKDIVKSFALEQKIGQLFMLAFPGKDPKILKPLIEKYNIGGCYVSQDNAETFEEARALTSELQELSKRYHSPYLPMLLGVDQEGAWGVLVPESVTGPGNLALGATGDPSLTADMYEVLGDEMLSAGYNAVLGPCSDVNGNPDNPIIEARSFGQFPDQVARHVEAAVRGGHRTGVVLSCKHFPGHGDTSIDTHREIPAVGKSLPQLMKEDLYPFQAGIDAGVDMVMTSHIRFPQIDPENPTTFSSKILKELLREKMGFKGLVVTDSMNMGAMRKHYKPEVSAVKAILAGCDIIMLAEEHYDHSDAYLEKQIETIEGVISAVRRGDLPESLIDGLAIRVVEFKLARLVPSLDYKERLSEAEKRSVETAAAEKSLTVVRGENALWPLPGGKKIVCINATPRASYARLMNARGIGPNQAKPAFDTFREELQKLRPEVAFVDHESCGAAGARLEEADVLLIVTENYPLPGEDFQKEEQLALANELLERYRDKTAMLGLRSSYELKYLKDPKCYISTFSSRTCSAKAAALAAAGKIPCEGRSPVAV